MRTTIINRIPGANRKPLAHILRWTGLTAAAAAGFVLNMVSANAQTATTMKNATGFIYTADEVGNTISAINLATGQVAIVPATLSPHNVQISADGARLLTVGDASMACLSL